MNIPWGDSTYLQYLSFGAVTSWAFNRTPTQAYFQQLLSNSASAPQVLIQFNYPGLGLPSYMWQQLVNLIERVSGTTLECNASLGGTCTMPGSCASYSDLFNSYSLTGMFANNTNYFISPFSSYAVDYQGNCQLLIYYLDTGYYP